jgi:hypothetical protein
MPRKKQKPRRLWLNVKQKGVKTTKRKFIQRLLRSIEDGTYRLPKKWKVTLLWRNKEDGRMKSGPWQEEMEDSAESSPGWDFAVTTYLKRMLR